MLRKTLFLLITLAPATALADGGNVHVTGNLLSSGCSVTGGTDLTFNLDKVRIDDLPSVNATWGRQQQNITLECDPGTRVNITFNGDTDGNNTILKNTGTAQGINIQLLDVLHGDHPINMGYSWAAIDSAQGSDTLPIAAQYIRTGDLVTGTVSASATYTLAYE